MADTISAIIPKLSTRATNCLREIAFMRNVPVDDIQIDDLRKVISGNERVANLGKVTRDEFRNVLGLGPKKMPGRTYSITLGPQQTADLLAALSKSRYFCIAHGASTTLRGQIESSIATVERARRKARGSVR